MDNRIISSNRLTIFMAIALSIGFTGCDASTPREISIAEVPSCVTVESNEIETTAEKSEIQESETESVTVCDAATTVSVTESPTPTPQPSVPEENVTETTKKQRETKTTSDTKTPSETTGNSPIITSTPTPIPATPTPLPTSTPTPVPTPTPEPTPTPIEQKRAEDHLGEVRAGVRDAVKDYCAWKDGFVFDDQVMANAKTRAEYAAANEVIGHLDIPGTVNSYEACGTSGCTYCVSNGAICYGDELEGKLQWYWTEHQGLNHYYFDAYQCYYDYAMFLCVEHSTRLASDPDNIYFGYGIGIRETSDDMYYDGYYIGSTVDWCIFVYIEGENATTMYLDYGRTDL